MQANPLQRAINKIGMRPLAYMCGVTYQAVQSWLKRGLPGSEWIPGGTRYALKIEMETEGKVPRQSLLDWSLKQRKRNG